MKHRPCLRPALALTFAALMLASATAPAERGRDRWRDAMRQDFAPSNVADRRISMDEAIARVQQRTGGRVLDARDEGNRYRVKILRDGEVRIVYVDAATGQIR